MKKLALIAATMSFLTCFGTGLYIVSNFDATNPDVTLTMDIQDTTQPQYILYSYSNVDNIEVKIDDGTSYLTSRGTYTMHQFNSVGLHKVRIYAKNRIATLYLTNNTALVKFIQFKAGLNFKMTGCANLRTVVMKPAVGEFQVPTSDWLANCTSLTTLSLPTLHDMSKKSTSYPFTNCTSLVSLDLPLTTNISAYAFLGSTALKTISATNLTVVGAHSFRGCVSLEHVDFPLATTLDTYTFNGCVALTSLTLPNVTTINGGSNFRGTSLQRLELPKLPLSYVQSNASDWYVPKGCTVVCSDGEFVRQ